jgi:hypothetical protein
VAEEGRGAKEGTKEEDRAKMSKYASTVPLLAPYKMGTFDLSHRSAFSLLSLPLCGVCASV